MKVKADSMGIYIHRSSLFNDFINVNGRVVECLKVFRWHQTGGSVFKLLVRVAIQRD